MMAVRTHASFRAQTNVVGPFALSIGGENTTFGITGSEYHDHLEVVFLQNNPLPVELLAALSDG